MKNEQQIDEYFAREENKDIFTQEQLVQLKNLFKDMSKQESKNVCE